MNWFQRRRLAFREVRNYFYIRKVGRNNKKAEDWIKFDLRTGYVGQIYTVISLRKEDMGEEETLQRMRVIQRLEPINKYLEGLNLSEIIYPDIVKIPKSQSWLVIYWPMREYFSAWRLVGQIIGLTVAIKLWFAYDVTSLIATFF